MRKLYLQRELTLARLGFRSYGQYRDSDFWKWLRAQVLERDAGKCQCCGEDGNNVHHLNYSRRTLLGLSARSLVTLCGECHRHGEFYHERKTKTSAANRRVGLARGFVRHGPEEYVGGPELKPKVVNQCGHTTKHGTMCRVKATGELGGVYHCRNHAPKVVEEAPVVVSDPGGFSRAIATIRAKRVEQGIGVN